MTGACEAVLDTPELLELILLNLIPCLDGHLTPAQFREFARDMLRCQRVKKQFHASIERSPQLRKTLTWEDHEGLGSCCEAKCLYRFEPYCKKTFTILNTDRAIRTMEGDEMRIESSRFWPLCPVINFYTEDLPESASGSWRKMRISRKDYTWSCVTVGWDTRGHTDGLQGYLVLPCVGNRATLGELVDFAFAVAQGRLQFGSSLSDHDDLGYTSV